ncbi:hypothetical protein MKEN_01012100 [Mycena kentingensis (nom. inval.)]|nr:hypothetical protein MKEN_01012100 [Mycena kentingensis (nom. inval.)]
MATAFETTTRNLRALGAMPIDDYLARRPEQFRYNGVQLETEPLETDQNAPPIDRLRSLCRQTVQGRISYTGIEFPSPTIAFEFVQNAASSIQCILTITRPAGETRSYKSLPNTTDREAAKSSAAQVAIDHGALQFIEFGDSDESKAVKGTLLEPLSQNATIASSSKTTLDISPVQCIESSCVGKGVRYVWYPFADSSRPAALDSHGACLKIQLSAHNSRVYSIDPTLHDQMAAKKRCAALAITAGVLDYIQDARGPFRVETKKNKGSASGWNLQTFFEAIPRPIEEDFGNRNAPQINAVSWLRNVVATAQGARFTETYHSLTTVFSGSQSRIVHGSLLRLKRNGSDLNDPQNTYSYLVEPQASSSKEAKAAVALLALCQGAGKLIRETASAQLALLSPEARTFTTQYVLSTLGNETRRICGVAPTFEYTSTGDTFSCTLTVHAKPPPHPPHTYTLPDGSGYATKADARIAVAFLAAKQGVIDLLRCNGEPEPPGYVRAWVFPADGAVPKGPAWGGTKQIRQRERQEKAKETEEAKPKDKTKKRKRDRNSNTPEKKQKVLSGGVSLGYRRRRSESLEDGELSG